MFGLGSSDEDDRHVTEFEGDRHVTDYEAADWESDDSGVRAATMHFDHDPVTLDYRYEDVDLDLHVNGGQEVLLVAADESTDKWVSTSLTLGPDEAEVLGKQLQLAAKFAREEKKADVRL